MVEQVGRYKIERELGRGGMGVVYLADDPMLGRKVAIKTVHFEITDATQREYLHTQLLRDARASAGLSHPNVVNVHDIIELGDTTYLVMEYIAGETLASRMQRAPAPEATWLLRVLRDIAAALDYTHRKGVVHRDIKPGNIMIDQHARTRIMDFGLARASEQRTASASGMVAGTIQYMSPEQIRGDALDGRADQFSMAAVAYEMLTGRPLFEARSAVTLAQKILHEVPTLAHVQNPTLPEATSTVLAKALDRQASGRYPTCTAFIEALIATFDGATVQALLRPPQEQPTVALTGMVDVGAELPKVSTAPVEKRSRWSGHAPLLIGVGMVLSVIVVTTLTLINGSSHGEAPKVMQQAPFSPSPPAMPEMQGRPPRGPQRDMGERMVQRGRPPQSPDTPEFPDMRGDPGHTTPEFGDRQRPERRGRRPQDGGRPDFTREIPEIPDVATLMRAPASGLMQSGRKELSARNYGVALQLFNVAAKLSPDDFQAYYYRGAAYLGAGNAKQAQADYEKVLQLKPDYAPGWYQLGVAMEHQQQWKEALEHYAHAARLQPNMADAFFASAAIYEQQSAWKKALAELDKAIAANPKYIRGYIARGVLKKKMGDPSANGDLQKAKDIGLERRPPR